MPVVKSFAPDVAIPDSLSLIDLILHRPNIRKVDSFRNADIIVDGISGRSYTFNQIESLSANVATNLHIAGFRKRNTLCVFLPNCPEYAIVILGILRIGAIPVTANPLYVSGELNARLCDSKSSAIFTISPLLEAVMEATKGVNIKAVYVLDKTDERQGNCRPFSELLVHNGAPPFVKINPKKDLAIMCYSSGTTGPPKGVMHTHYSMVANIIQMEATSTYGSANPSGGQDVVMALLPFFHIYGLAIVMMMGLCQRSKLISLPRFDPELFLGVIPKYRITNLFLVPPLALFMAKHPMVSDYDLSSIRTVGCGAAPLGKELADEVCRRCHFDSLIQGFGMTECLVSHVPSTEPRSGSVGRPVANTEAKIIDLENGRILGPKQDGELCIRGPQVMLGYLGRPKATAETIDQDGWLHTGDIAHYDEDGYFYIVDRLKELIKYKAFQVAPAELENLLLTHPAIADCAVIGVPDERAGELPRAYVVLKPSFENTNPTEIINFVAAKVSDHNKLRGGVVYIPEIPKSPSGKILRRVLKLNARSGSKL